MVAVSITREEHDAADLRREASRSRDADAARRMLALALVLEGASRTDAARTCGMDRQTLRDWVHRYNAEGLAGLSDRRGQVGPKPRLSPAQEAVVAELVRQGPDLAEHGVVRWRRADLAAVIATRFEVRLAERTVGTLLRARCCAGLASGGCRCGRSTRRTTRQPRRHIKKLRRPRRGSDPGSRPWQADRTLVAGRGKSRVLPHIPCCCCAVMRRSGRG